MLIEKKEYYLIDQEWKMENVPYEYILYRGILSILSHFDKIDEKMKYYFDKYNITIYFSKFQKLEQFFYDSLESNEYKKLKKYHNYNLINTKDILMQGDLHEEIIKQKIEEINLLNVDNKILSSVNEKQKQLLDDILNSKSWKLTKPLRKFLSLFSKK